MLGELDSSRDRQGAESREELHYRVAIRPKETSHTFLLVSKSGLYMALSKKPLSPSLSLRGGIMNDQIEERPPPSDLCWLVYNVVRPYKEIWRLLNPDQQFLVPLINGFTSYFAMLFDHYL